MKKLLTGLCAGTIALSFGLAGLAPAMAAPIVALSIPGEASVTQQVQFGTDLRRDGRQPQQRMQRRGERNEGRNSGRFERRGNHAYYNGHRGESRQRRGYRQHNGFWFPAGAFITGAIIGGALADPGPSYRGGGRSHVQWCYDRWRSYRAEDNSYQPFNGPRQECRSPYN
jgi:PPE-repeat protein